MNAAVLVLDVGMRPLRVENWQRAICGLFLGKVEVVEWKYHSKDRTIQSTSGPWPVPSVVRVLSQFKRDRIRVKFSRINIYTRDEFKCQFCATRFESEDLTFDHVIPRSRGGKTTWENIVTSCVPCNRQKRDRHPHEVVECRNFMFASNDLAVRFAKEIQGVPSVTSVTTVKDKVVIMFELGDDFEKTLAMAVASAEELDVLSIKTGMELLKRPRKPGYLPAMTVKMDTRCVPEEWKPYWTSVLETE
jgi:5-methylcytosine-specific restriction endonuclease McrA